MKRIFLAALLLLSVSAYSQNGRYPFAVTPVPSGGAGPSYITFSAWYEFAGDYTDEGGNFDGTNYGASLDGDTLVYFPNADGGDRVDIGAVLSSGVDTFTISYIYYRHTDGNTNHYYLADCEQNQADPGIYIFSDGTGSSSYNLTMFVQNSDNTRSYATTVSSDNCSSTWSLDTYYHVVHIFYRLTGSQTKIITYKDAVHCNPTVGDTIADKLLEQSAAAMYVGNTWLESTYGARDGDKMGHLMFFEYDLRANTTAWDALMADPYTMPTQ